MKQMEDNIKIQVMLLMGLVTALCFNHLTNANPYYEDYRTLINFGGFFTGIGLSWWAMLEVY